VHDEVQFDGSSQILKKSTMKAKALLNIFNKSKKEIDVKNY